MNIFIGILIFIVNGLLFMCLTYYVAVQKGRDSKNWILMGFLLGFLAFLTIGFVPDKPEPVLEIRQTRKTEYEDEVMNNKKLNELIMRSAKGENG